MSTSSTVTTSTLLDDVAAIADRLALPPVRSDRPEHAPERIQSLADGAAGTALLHIERALTGTGHWSAAHRWLATVVQGGVLATLDSSLFRGAPAVAFALHLASADGTGRYATAQRTLERAISALAQRRVDRAYERIARAELPTFAEYDVISGLTGIGAHLLRHAPGDDALHRILGYLVRLTEPMCHDRETVPGWWTRHGPDARISAAFPGGHANLGLAHGITGPLALLALARRRGIVVDGHLDAIERINAYLDSWRQVEQTGTWWPQWITCHARRTGRPDQAGPPRASWCYGTPGLARAQQLAGFALGDHSRRRLAEEALASCLADQRQLRRSDDACLCHGAAGLLLTAWRIAVDAADLTLLDRLRPVADRLVHHTVTTAPGDGLLDGRIGVALALSAVAHDKPPTSGWDACLLIV